MAPLRLELDDLSSAGDGVGAAEGASVEVPGAFPGELEGEEELAGAPGELAHDEGEDDEAAYDDDDLEGDEEAYAYDEGEDDGEYADDEDLGDEADETDEAAEDAAAPEAPPVAASRPAAQRRK